MAVMAVTVKAIAAGTDNNQLKAVLEKMAVVAVVVAMADDLSLDRPDP
jgi:hypothetical protein